MSTCSSSRGEEVVQHESDAKDRCRNGKAVAPHPTVSIDLLLAPIQESEHEEQHQHETDEDSSSTIVSHENRYTQHCLHTFLRHNSFFLGSFFATIASLTDLQDAWMDFQAEENVHAYEGLDDDGYYLNPWRNWTLYKLLLVASAFMYLLDSLIHIFAGSDHDNIDHEDYSISSSAQFAISLVFGVAASLDLLSCFMDDDYNSPWPSYYLGAAGMHFYLLSALMTLATNCRVYFVSTKWLLLGDVLFVTGSVVDVCVSYWLHPNAPVTDSSWLRIACWSLVSSALWLVDSIIYRLVDEDLFEPIQHFSIVAGCTDVEPTSSYKQWNQNL